MGRRVPVAQLLRCLSTSRCTPPLAAPAPRQPPARGPPPRCAARCACAVQDRDVPLDQRVVRSVKFSDPEVCKHALAGLCPFGLFMNTKSDLGPCE